MDIIQTPSCDMLYRGDGENVGDMPCWREAVPHDGSDTNKAPTAIFCVYAPTDEERKQIAAGANLRMGIWYMEPIPPVSLAVTDEKEVTDGDSKQAQRGNHG